MVVCSLAAFHASLEGQSKCGCAGISGPGQQVHGHLSSMKLPGQAVATSVCIKIHRLALCMSAAALRGDFRGPTSGSMLCAFGIASDRGAHACILFSQSQVTARCRPSGSLGAHSALRGAAQSWAPPVCTELLNPIVGARWHAPRRSYTDLRAPLCFLSL